MRPVISSHNSIVEKLRKIALVVTFGGLLFGVDTGVINGAIPYMAAKNQLNLTPAQEGLVTSGITLGAAVGALFVGKLADRFGRKRILSALAVIFFTFTCACSVAPNALSMIIFRFLLGLAVGGVSVIVPTYLAEIATTNLRGELVTQNELMITGGQLLAFTVNAILASLFPGIDSIWRYMIAFGMIPSLALFIGAFYVPESPRWLVMKGKSRQAVQVLSKIRSSRQKCRQEVKSIRRAVNHDKSLQKASLKDLSHPWIRHLVMIGAGLGILQQFVGINIMMYYGTSILMKFGFAHNAALIANIGNGLTSFIATAIGMRLMGTVKRRKMLITGIIGTCSSMAVITVSIVLLKHSPLLPYLVILSTMTFLAFFQSSISPTTWTLLSEIFPQNLRGLGTGISTFTLWLANFIVGFVFPILLTNFGGVATFGVFIGCNIVSLIFAYTFVPETQGKSLEQIQAAIEPRQRHSHNHHSPHMP